MRAYRLAGVAMSAALVLTGCGAQPEDGTKAGSDSIPVTLRLGTPELESAVYGPWVREFAVQANELSGGSLTIDIEWETVPWHPGSEVEIAQHVIDGTLDLALVPVRAWTDLDVPSLTPLMTPFLVDSEQLAAELSEGELVEELMAGVRDHGAAGLALWPEGIRRVLSFETPIVTAADFEGLRIRVPRSNLSHQMYEALGAHPVEGRVTSGAVVSGEFTAVESWADSWLEIPGPKAYTANLPFYAKFQVVTANEDAFERLSAEQQLALTEAAARARDLAARDLSEGTDLTAAFCDAGVSVVHAAAEEIDILRQRAAPVVTQIVADPTAGDLVARIASVKDTIPPSPPEPCDTGEASEPPDWLSHFLEAPVGTSNPADFPEGTYRSDISRELLEEVGLSSEEAYYGSGLSTLTIGEGTFDWHSPNSKPADCSGTATTAHGTLVLVIDDSCGIVDEVVLVSQWSLDGHDLTFHPVLTAPGVEEWDASWGLFFITAPWTQVE